MKLVVRSQERRWGPRWFPSWPRVRAPVMKRVRLVVMLGRL